MSGLFSSGDGGASDAENQELEEQQAQNKAKAQQFQQRALQSLFSRIAGGGGGGAGPSNGGGGLLGGGSNIRG